MRISIPAFVPKGLKDPAWGFNQVLTPGAIKKRTAALTRRFVLVLVVVLMVAPKLFIKLGAKAHFQLWSVSDPRL
jgi:hypothetical protein